MTRRAIVRDMHLIRRRSHEDGELKVKMLLPEWCTIGHGQDTANYALRRPPSRVLHCCLQGSRASRASSAIIAQKGGL